MAGIVYGNGIPDGLPPVNLPAFDDGNPNGPLRIQMGNTGIPQDATGQGGQGLGPFAPYQPEAPQAAAQPQQQSGLGPFAPYSPQQPSDAPPMGGGEAALRGAAQGLSFGFAPAIAGAASGVASALGGGDFSTAYDQTRQQQQSALDQAQSQHPYISTAAEIVGGIPSMFMPGVGITKAAQVGATAVPRILQAVRSGAVAGGLYGAGNQTSQGASAANIGLGAAGGALAGGALGGTLGSAIEGGSMLANRVGSIVRGNRNPDLEAQRLVINALQQDQKKVGNVASDLPALNAGSQAGLDLRLGDMGGATTHGLMRAATNLSPEARDVIGDVVQPRFQQQGDRIGRFIRSRFGGVDSDVANEAIQDLARKQNGPAYRAAYEKGDRQIWTPELERLTAAPSVQSALSTALSKWKDYAVRDGFGAMNPPFRVENGGIIRVGGKGMPVYPNIQFWDYAARELQDRAREAPIGSEQGKLYNDLARMLKNELDKNVPEYKAAREGAARFFKARDIVDAGANFLSDTSISLAKSAQVIHQMTPAERELFKRSYAAALASKMERINDNRDALNSMFVKNGPARQRNLIALGETDAGRLEALLRVEAIADRTRKALGNSTTIQQGHDAGKFAGALAAWEGFKELGLNPAYLIAAPLIFAGRQTAKKVDEKVFTKVAELLVSDDPKLLARGVQLAANDPNIRTALRYASDLSARQLVAIMGPSGIGAAALAAREHFKGSEHALPHPNHYDQYDNQGQQVAPQ